MAGLVRSRLRHAYTEGPERASGGWMADLIAYTGHLSPGHLRDGALTVSEERGERFEIAAWFRWARD